MASVTGWPASWARANTSSVTTQAQCESSTIRTVPTQRRRRERLPNMGEGYVPQRVPQPARFRGCSGCRSTETAYNLRKPDIHKHNVRTPCLCLGSSGRRFKSCQPDTKQVFDLLVSRNRSIARTFDDSRNVSDCHKVLRALSPRYCERDARVRLLDAGPPSLPTSGEAPAP